MYAFEIAEILLMAHQAKSVIKYCNDNVVKHHAVGGDSNIIYYEAISKSRMVNFIFQQIQLWFILFDRTIDALRP